MTVEEEQWSLSGFRARPTRLTTVAVISVRGFYPGAGRVSLLSGVALDDGGRMKGSDKPKKLQKKAPQKTLKEKRSAKKAKGAR